MHEALEDRPYFTVPNHAGHAFQPVDQYRLQAGWRPANGPQPRSFRGTRSGADHETTLVLCDRACFRRGACTARRASHQHSSLIHDRGPSTRTAFRSQHRQDPPLLPRPRPSGGTRTPEQQAQPVLLFLAFHQRRPHACVAVELPIVQGSRVPTEPHHGAMRYCRRRTFTNGSRSK